MDITNELERLCKIIEKEIAKVNDKLEDGGGELTGGDASYIDALTHTIKSIKTTLAMVEDGYSRDYNGYGGYSNDMRPTTTRYYMGRSSARGRKRDSMGRYSRGYSRAGEDIAERLQELAEQAPDDKIRQEIERVINKMDNM